MSRAQTFDQLQANITHVQHGKPVPTPDFRDAALAFGYAYIAECIRLGIIGGPWAAMRNTMTLGATTPLAHQCASWELEVCPGSETFTGSDQLPSSLCHKCLQDVPHKGRFLATHKRPARS